LIQCAICGEEVKNPNASMVLTLIKAMCFDNLCSNPDRFYFMVDLDPIAFDLLKAESPLSLDDFGNIILNCKLGTIEVRKQK
jgi:hypothetical protein